MLLYTLVCSCLLMLGAQADTPPHLKLLVGLFNELVGMSVTFHHDFGSGVPLLNGEAKVHMYRSIELLPFSKVSLEDGLTTLVLKCPLGFRIISRTLEDLNIENCYMTLQYSVDKNATKPTSVWLDSCSVVYTNGTVPPFPRQVLPVLSQALYLTAERYLSFQGEPQGLTLSDVQEIVAYLLYHLIN